MRKKIVAGNWKMNKTVAEAQQLVAELIPGLDAVKGIDRVLCPPFTALYPIGDLLKDTEIGLGAQNLFWEAAGAYTAEVAPAMVADTMEPLPGGSRVPLERYPFRPPRPSHGWWRR